MALALSYGRQGRILGSETLMLGERSLTFQEFAMAEPLPLATVQEAVLEFLRDRDDVSVFGAQAVNAYVGEPRMSQDVDLLSPRAAELAEDLRAHLSARFHIAITARDVAGGTGHRPFQVQKPRNRHLVDVRQVATLPPTQRIAGVLVVTPPELIAGKVIAFHRRRGQPKSGTDWRDLASLLLRFPELKTEAGPVRDRLVAAGAESEAMQVWRELAAQEIVPEEDEGAQRLPSRRQRLSAALEPPPSFGSSPG